MDEDRKDPSLKNGGKIAITVAVGVYTLNRRNTYPCAETANAVRYTAIRGVRKMKEKRGVPPSRSGGKIIVTVAAVMIAAMFVASAVPIVFSGDDGDAVLGANTNVAITQTMTVANIESAINSATASAASGDTVTVTGTKTDADAPMTIDIPSGVKLIWTAVYIGSVDTTTGETDMCIELTGDGTFEIADGADIKGTELKLIYIGVDEMLNMIVSGGSILNTNQSKAFCIHSEGEGSFEMTGGTIMSSGSDNSGISCAAVYYFYGDMTVSGGTISTESSLRFAIAIYASSGDLVISGGTISSTGERGRTIHTLFGHVTITGGTVTSDGLESVCIIARGGLTMSGGEVAASGEYSFAIRSPFLDVIITDGTVSASGKESIAVFMGDNGSVPLPIVPVLAITGGIVKASGEDSNAISAHMNGSLAVYLKGTISGGTNLIRVNTGVIVEVDTLDIPDSYNDTSDGITVIRGALFGLEDFVWITTGDVPVLSIGGEYFVDWAGAGALVSAAPIAGVTSPVALATPSTAITDGTGFSASLSWNGSPSTFTYDTEYTATITLTATIDHTFSGGFADTVSIAGFTVNGIAPVWVSNDGTTLVFTVTFPTTGPVPEDDGSGSNTLLIIAVIAVAALFVAMAALLFLKKR
jgi:hypothetical protein